MNALPLEQRVDQAIGEVWLRRTNRELPNTSDILADPSNEANPNSVEHYLRLIAAGHSDGELRFFGLTSPRQPGLVVAEESELPDLFKSLLHSGVWVPRETKGWLDREVRRSEIILDMGATGVGYNFTLGIATAFMGKKRPEVRGIICRPFGLYVTALGAAAIDYCVGSPNETARRLTEERGLPSDPQELGARIVEWNRDPRHTGLTLPVPPEYSALLLTQA
jgi:hypothetical protein